MGAAIAFVCLPISVLVFGVAMVLMPGWSALIWLLACSGIVAIVPTVLDELRARRGHSPNRQLSAPRGGAN